MNLVRGFVRKLRKNKKAKKRDKFADCSSGKVFDYPGGMYILSDHDYSDTNLGSGHEGGSDIGLATLLSGQHPFHQEVMNESYAR